MVFVQRIRNSWRNKKPPTHQGGGLNPPAETYLVSFPTTHRRELLFPIKGTLALPLPGCQTRFESFLMLAWSVSSWHPDAIRLCVIGGGSLNYFRPNVWPAHGGRAFVSTLGSLLESITVSDISV